MPIVIGLGEGGIDNEWSDPLGLLGGKSPEASTSTTKASEPIEAPAAASSSTKTAPDASAAVESQGEAAQAARQSALSSLSDRDKNDLINTVIAEAAGEGEQGMFAVASVIKNRASRRGKSPADIIREPDQFTGYSAPGEGVRKAMEDPAMRAMAETALEGVFSGKTPDPTGGADHYHATYVSPSWAKGMPETARFGKHIFYNSKPGEKQPDSAGAIESAWAQKPEEQPGLGRQAFDAVLNPAADRPEGSAPNPEAKGLARLVRPDEEKPNRGGGNLSFVHKGQDAIAPEFKTILTESSSALGRDFTIQSGYRAPNHPVEARKEKPGQHTSRTAADISLKGMNESERAALVQDLYSRGVRRFGTYTNMPDVLHVDMKDQTGKGSPWFMHDTSNKFIGRAPKWFQNIATNPGEPRAVARNTGPVEGIVVGEDFAISDPLGLMGGANPLAETAKRDGEAARAAQAQAQAEAERQGMITANTQANEASEAEFQRLSGQDPDRYEMVPASELDQWSTKWKAENQSTSRFGDFWKNWGIGASQTSQGMENLNRLAISKLPYGDKINAGLDSIDRWFGNGKTKAERMQETDQVQEARLSDKSQAALKKTVFNEDGSFGEALTDPDWYLAQVARSAPATVASMAPGGFMARGAYVTAVARGASAEVAAATAARTATIAGGITEGIMGGADAALSVKQQIAQIPREALLETDAVKTLIGEGMTEDAAIEAVSNNVQTQAMVAAGVATGIFGGMGDRALAKIIGEGVSGNIASRTAKGAVKGAVSESLFEEAPQSAGSQVAENWAMQTVEPGRKLSEGVAEATVSGAAVGGAMGGAMGGAGGAISRAEPAPPATAAKGPLGRAVEYGNQRADERAASQPDVQPIMGGQTPAGQSTAPAPTSSQFTDGRPEIRSTVRVDAEGVEPFMGQVEGYDGDEAIIVDGGSGEVYQIPISSITKIADAPDRVNAVDQAIERKRSGEPIPEYSNDPALEPDAPRAADIKTEPAPAGSLVPASSRLNFPKPGSRVTVEADGIKSFTGRVERYTGENGDEAIVVDDDNKPYQVPLSALKVSGLTPKQIEAEDLARNPPIPREIGDAGPLSRKIGKATVKLPDERHADLYDFAKEKFISSRLAGASQLEVNERLKPHAQKLADAFGISPEAVMQMADDYRFRVERAAASSNSALPVNMNPYDAKRLRKWQAEAKGEDLSTAESPESWWDLALTDADRKRILAQAGVKRSEKHTWGSLSKAIQQKLLPYQPKGEAAEDVNPIDFSGVPDSVFSIFPDMKVTPDGLLPLNHFSRDQQTALKKAGLVTTAATKDGGEYEGVDPAHLWPERDRRAKEQSKNPSKEITPEERNAAIERNATIYDRAADEEEENGSEDRAAEYRAKARELRARKAKLGTSAKRASSESDVTEMVDAYLDYRADWFEQEGVPLDDPDVAEYMRRTALARDESDSDRADRSEAERNLIEKHGKNFTNVLQADWSDFRDNPAEHGYQPAASTDNAARVSNDGDYSALVAAYLDESAQWLEDAGFLYDKDVPEYLRRAAQARDEEKTSDPADWSKDESEAWASKNWKRFSELRGYSPSEIANFERYLELSDKLAERHGINSVVMLHTDWADFRARRAEPEGQPAASIDDAAREAATSPTNDRPEPTQAQKEAGNYKVGRIKLAGMDISIENPAGSERKGVDGSGKPWSVTMKSHYGYIRGTVGRDKDHIDVFVKPGTEALDGSAPVFVVNQTSPNGRFDEHKVMLGYASQEEAEAAYLENYTKGWKLGPVSPTTIDGFKSWLLDGDKQRHFREVGSEPDAAEVASLYKELADRLPPADFARKVATKGARAQEAAIIEPGGKLLVIKPTGNPDGDHSEFFARLSSIGATERDGYVRITAYGSEIGVHPMGAPAERSAATLKALRTAAKREGLAVMDEAGTVPPATGAEVSEPNAEAAPAASPEPVKWFGTREKAEGYIAKNKLAGSHEIVEANRRFEVRPKASAAAGPLPNATAPEHQAVGVDDRELAQIVEEFKNAQADMMTGDHPVTNVFQPPKKSEIVRLNDKAKVYHREHGWMTPSQAKDKLEEWKAHARAQGDNPEIRSDNSRKVVLSLFDLSGEWSKPWEEAGYQVFRFDIQADPDMGDVNNFSTEFFGDWFGDFDGQDIYAILAACPCTDFASSGARHFAAKDKDGRTVASVKLVQQTLRTIEYFKPAVWALENPVGRIEDLGGLPPWRLSFDPNHIGDPYTKKTLIWGRFNGDLPVAPVEPTEGSKMHKLYGGKSQATKNARSVTPEGFSYGFFMANNAHDHAAMAVAGKFDRLDRKLIGQAIDAGITPEQIEGAVEDLYYMDLDDDAANDAIRNLISPPQPPKAKAPPAKAEAEAKAAKEAEPEAPGKADIFAGNKLFTADAVEKARARMRSKLGQLNSGIDPELLVDGMTIAGAYIEAGIRKFSDYAKQMTDDFGDGIKPYLLSFYEGARNYPGLDVDGMTSPDEARRLHAELNTKLPASEAPALGAELAPPKDRKPKKGRPEDKTLSADYGVENIDAYSDEGEQAKAAFLKDAAGYLKTVAKILTDRGFTPTLDKKGRANKPVSTNEAGIAVSGDVSLHLRHAETGASVYANITGSALRGTVPTNKSGVSIMFRSSPDGSAFATGGGNLWAPVDLTAEQLADLIEKNVRNQLARADFIRQAGAKQQRETDNESEKLDLGGPRALEGTPAAAVRPTAEGGNAGQGSGRSGGADVSGGGSARTERDAAGRGVPDGEGDVPVSAGGGQQRQQQRSNDASDGGSSEAGAAPRGAVDPESFVSAPGGSLDFGEINAEVASAINRQPGKIRLRAGTAAWGLQHIKARHEDQIKAIGFPTVEAFVHKIASGFTAIYRREGRSLDVVLDDGARGKLIVQLEPSAEGDFYDVKTATPIRSDQFKNGKPLWEQAGPSKSSAEANSLNPKDQSTTNIGEALEKVHSAATPAQKLPADHVIKEGDAIGEGGSKTKFRGNIAAIKILRQLSEEQRPANRDEQAQLAKWVGWGGLRSAFYREDGTANKGWEKEAKELKELLTTEEYRAAESSTRNAHYTSPQVVKGLWAIVQHLGFRGGRALEPSVGAGNFLGLIPANLRKGTHFTGVELDHITGGIAKNLYPASDIQAPLGFEKLSMPDGYFDLAIGNPPFGSERLFDKERPKLSKLSIHNYFFAKSVAGLKPGGVLAMVVTNRFLDSGRSTARETIAQSADLIGAIRLPNNAFLKNAGTEVTTDIIILRKREEGEAPASTAWTEVGEFTDKNGKTVPLNRYFIDNPDMMLGEFGAFGSMYGPDESALIAREGADIEAELRRATGKLPENIMKVGAPVEPEAITVADGVETALVGSAFLSADGSVHVRLPDLLNKPRSEPMEFSDKVAPKRVAGLIRIRDAFTRLRRAQIDEASTDDQLQNLRDRLNKVYDTFVAAHGPINEEMNKRVFRDDPTWPQLAALEQNFRKAITDAAAKKTGEKPRKASAEKAAIFSKRTQQPYRMPDNATSAKDALAMVLNEIGRVDVDRMEQLYGKSRDEIIEELGDLVFRTPFGDYETADSYLSGNVKQKLAQAEEAAKDDPSFRRNIEVLREVQPADIEPVDIDVKPGSPWVPSEYVAEFVNHITEHETATAFYSRSNAKWDIDYARHSDAASLKWATDRTRLAQIIDAALNAKTITVNDRVGDKQVVNEAATEAANEKVERVKAEWDRWIWNDDARRDVLARLYNDTFNTDVTRRFDGEHLTLPGKVGDDVISLRPHQKAFVWRTMQSSTTLADHTVGAGKTFAAITSAMEKRRIGQARKPMFVVPNHLVGQWAADFIRLYPNANILAATKKDFERGRRKQLFARISTGDYDAVIVAHSSFTSIGMNAEYQAAFIERQVADLEASITELRAATGEKSRNVRQLTTWRDNLRTKMETLLAADRKDEGLTFDELGVDALYVDEAHEFKNLAFATSMTRVAGLGSKDGSDKATDLYIKTQYIKERTGGNIVFLTGTPISNTMAEMYTVQRYLDDESLQKMGVAHFDAWARVFGEVSTDYELSPSGQYKLNSRFRRFVNLPELMQRYLRFADVITNDDIKRQLAAIGKTLPLPRVKGGKPQIIVVDRSPDQTAYIGEGRTNENGELVFPVGSLVHRAENLPKKAAKGQDNMLKVMSDARKAALDMRMIDEGYGDYAGSKIHRAADEMVRIYRGSTELRGTQLVFIDLSTPKSAKATEGKKLRELIKKAEEGDAAAQAKLDDMSPDEFSALDGNFSVYDDLKQKLIDRGVPEKEIAFIHDANTDIRKEELFGQVRSGRIRFLFGSTPKMGAGTNVQNRLVALHHLDAPWRPSDLEQRDGRGIRQGNELYNADPENFEIEILRYATEKTLDARQWQTIEDKAKFIGQLRKGTSGERSIEDIGGEAANAAEMKAAASGNPLILEEMDARRQLKVLDNKKREHDREQHSIKARLSSLRREREVLADAMDDAKADAEAASRFVDGDTLPTLDGTSFDKPKEFGAALISVMRKFLLTREDITATGTLGDFRLKVEWNHSKAFFVTIEGAKVHSVNVEDASSQDATGLAQKVTNTVRRLRDAPAAMEQRTAQIDKAIPGVEAQTGEWPLEQELADLKVRHRALIDQLRPKKKGEANAETVISAAEGGGSVDYDPPISGKIPDAPQTGGTGDLRSLNYPARNGGKSVKAHAINTIYTVGRATGHEYIVGIDDDGAVVEYGSAGHPRSTGMNNKLLSALMNPTRRMVIYHNHPTNSPFSTTDISFLAYPGLYSAWAIGHAGAEWRAALTPQAREHLSRISVRAGLRDMQSIAMIAQDKVVAFLREHSEAKAMPNSVSWHIAQQASMEALARANIIDIQTNEAYDFGRLEGLEAFINQSAEQLAKGFFDDKSARIRGANRPALTLRHIAEVEGAPVDGQPDGSGRSAAAGLADAGAQNDPREVIRNEGSRSGLSESLSPLPARGAGISEQRIVQEVRGKLVDIQPALLKAIPLNYFAELAQANMTAVKDYLRVKRSMDAYRGKKHAEADAVAQEWLKYTRLGFNGKDKAKAAELADLMHESTLAGVDPTDPTDEMKKLPGYHAIMARWAKIPPAGKRIYRDVLIAYGRQSAELDEILLDNVRKAQEIAKAQAEARYKRNLQKIRDAGLKGVELRKAEEDAASNYKAEVTKATWAGKARMTKLRIAFESSRMKGPYFPLARFGRYFVTEREVDGKVVSFSKFETAAERDRYVKSLSPSRGVTVETGVMEQAGDLRRAMDPRLVAEIETMLGDAGVSNELMDQIWQRYLETMPDLSTRKRQIHRKGTAGFSRDAMRAFASHMFHAAHQMGRLKYGLELQELTNIAVDQAKEADDTTAGMTLANELVSRHAWVMNPTGSKVAQTMTSAAFVWYLASSPASAMVNLSQTFMMGVPILGARFGGITKAASALIKASGDLVKGKGSLTRADLPRDEQAALDAFYESGLIDRTQSHDIAGVGETGVEYSPLRARIMGVISWAFHKAEVVNREVTALAAYRLARDNGARMADAIDIAHDMTWKTHFDYSNSSRPALMQNDFAKVALVFRQHNVNMLYRVFRDVHQSIKGGSPQARREARYQLAGIVGMMTLFAGVSGTIGFNLLMGLASMVFGDDDDPMDFEQKFKANVVEILGPQLGGMVLNGVPGHLTGVDLSSRIGMPDLWFRSPTRELQGKDEFEYWVMQSAGASVSMLGQMYTGFRVMTDEGEVARGLEMMAPKAARDLMKAYRYWDEGVTSIDGDEIIPVDQMTVHDVVAQALGFTPAGVAETWDRSSSLRNADRKVRETRQRTINRWAMAAMAGDDEEKSEALAEIRRYNANPVFKAMPITRETLKRSIKTRVRNAKMRDGGVLIRNQELNRELRQRLADSIYRQSEEVAE